MMPRQILITAKRFLFLGVMGSVILAGSSLDAAPLVERWTNQVQNVPDTGTPDPPPRGNRGHGGTRPVGSCSPVSYGPTAITPENANGHTTADYPRLWFYIPYAAEAVETIEFSLINQDFTQTLYRTNVLLGNTPGIINISLPQDQLAPLVLNEHYHWYLRLSCELKDPSDLDDFVLDGWITRTTVNPTISADGIWFDTLNAVATLYQANPQDASIQAQWKTLLESVGLEYLSSAPLPE